jgi:hypothetical protein
LLGRVRLKPNMARATTFALVAVLALAAAALASPPSWFLDRKSNLDGDRALERIHAAYDVSSNHKYQRAEIAAFDTCAGRERRYELAPPGTFMAREAIFAGRALGRPAVLFSMTYADDHWIARVVQLRPRQKGACPTPALLFDYSSVRPPYPTPEGYTVGNITAAPGEHSSAYAGKELLLTEEYSSPRLSPVRKIRHTYLRYRSSKQRYVPYRTEIVPA